MTCNDFTCVACNAFARGVGIVRHCTVGSSSVSTYRNGVLSFLKDLWILDSQLHSSVDDAVVATSFQQLCSSFELRNNRVYRFNGRLSVFDVASNAVAGLTSSIDGLAVYHHVKSTKQLVSLSQFLGVYGITNCCGLVSDIQGFEDVVLDARYSCHLVYREGYGYVYYLSREHNCLLDYVRYSVGSEGVHSSALPIYLVKFCETYALVRDKPIVNLVDGGYDKYKDLVAVFDSIDLAINPSVGAINSAYMLMLYKKKQRDVDLPVLTMFDGFARIVNEYFYLYDCFPNNNLFDIILSVYSSLLRELVSFNARDNYLYLHEDCVEVDDWINQNNDYRLFDSFQSWISFIWSRYDYDLKALSLSSDYLFSMLFIRLHGDSAIQSFEYLPFMKALRAGSGSNFPLYILVITAAHYGVEIFKQNTLQRPYSYLFDGDVDDFVLLSLFEFYRYNKFKSFENNNVIVDHYSWLLMFEQSQRYKILLDRHCFVIHRVMSNSYLSDNLDFVCEKYRQFVRSDLHAVVLALYGMYLFVGACTINHLIVDTFKRNRYYFLSGSDLKIATKPRPIRSA